MPAQVRPGSKAPDAPPRPSLRELKKRRTREAIADAALELFLERGFDAVTIADVAERAEVDMKTIYNYFTSKPDLFYHRLEAFQDSLVAAVRDREPGESALSAFARFLLATHARGLLGDEQATVTLRAITEMIVASPTLLAYEDQIYARFTAALADLLAAETGAPPTDVEPAAVAHALIGLHRSLVAYVRAGTLSGTPNARLARSVRTQAKRAVATLTAGLGDYGIK
jgi:AcrR family transcriptional regulator